MPTTRTAVLLPLAALLVALAWSPSTTVVVADTCGGPASPFGGCPCGFAGNGPTCIACDANAGLWNSKTQSAAANSYWSCRAQPRGTALIATSGVYHAMWCPQGTRGMDTMSTVNCVVCDPGTYSDGAAGVNGMSFLMQWPNLQSNTLGQVAEGWTKCTACPAGRWSPANRLSDVQNCRWAEVGRYTPGGNSAPVNPPPGYVASGGPDGIGYRGSTGFTACQAGTAPGPRFEWCFTCAPGKYSPSPATPACIDVDSGYVQPKSGAVTGGTQCPAGRYSAPSSPWYQVICDPCEPGMFTPGGDVPCAPCPDGQYAPSGGAASCQACGTGWVTASSWAANGGQVLSTSLPAPAGGAWPGENARASCLYARPGYYSNNGVETRCPAGQYQLLSGQTACVPCDTGRYTTTTGQTQCQIALPGTYETGSRDATANCPAGQFQAAASANSCATCPTGRTTVNSAGTLLSGQVECRACPPGRYYQTNNQACGACPPGTYLPLSMQQFPTSCVACPAGSWSAPAAATCTACPVGTYQGASTECSGEFWIDAETNTAFQKCGKPACFACGVGTFQNNTGQAACRACPTGRYADGLGASVCLTCAPGTYANSATTCTACPAGRYRLNNERSGCDSCPPGTHAPDAGHSTCLGCSAGTFQAGFGATRCWDCGPGNYSAMAGMTACTKCAPGSYAPLGDDGWRLRECVPCPVGKFTKDVGALSCQNCTAAAQFQDVAGQTYCQTCPIGRSNNRQGMAACALCAPGRYQDDPASNTCKACTALQYSDVYGATACQDCPPGRFGVGTGKSACTECDVGYMQSLAGQSACTPCGQGMYSAGRGAANCTLCAPGTFAIANPWPNTNCTACPLSTVTLTPGQSQCTACTNNTYTPNIGWPVCLACPNDTTTNQAAAIACEQCNPGFHSNEVGCIVCETGRYNPRRGAAQCELCPKGKYTTETQATACVPCPVGKYTNTDGHGQECTLCEPGRFGGADGLTTCERCREGFSSTQGSFACLPCQLGRYAAINETHFPCPLCSAGTYQPSTGGTECFPCAASMAAPEEGSSSCTQCTAGKYAPVDFSPVCLDCEVGRYSRDGATVCAECDVGRFSIIPGQPDCGYCAAGTFANATGMAQCHNCPPGTFNTAVGLQNCTACDVGQYAISPASVSCTPCPLGRYANTTGNGECPPCSAGTYRGVDTDNNATSCAVCSVNQFAAIPGLAGCTACAPGEFSLVPGAGACQKCRRGTYAPDSSQSCEPCAPGKFAFDDASTACKDCELGRYSNTTGLFECDRCPSGTTTFAEGRQSCEACPAGTYSSSEGQSSCMVCDKGSFKATQSAEPCTKCPASSQTSFDSTSCDCLVGYYLSDEYGRDPTCNPSSTDPCAAFTCQLCPPGGDCHAPGTTAANMAPLTGWWRGVSGTVFVQCVNAACLGGPGSPCKKGYKGNLCTECDLPEYGRDNQYDCSVCPDPVVNQLRLIGGLVVLIIIVCVVTVITVNSAEKTVSKSSILAKIWMSNIQLNALAAGFAYDWPPAMNAFFQYIAAGSNVTTFMSLDCFFGTLSTSQFFVKCLVLLLLLPVIALLPALFWVLPNYILVRREHNKLMRTPGLPELAIIERELRLNTRWKRVRDLYVTGELIVLFLLHPTITSAALSMFACKQLGAGSGDFYLLPDLSQKCYTSTHVLWILAVALPLLVLFVIGLPLFAWLKLYFRSDLIDECEGKILRDKEYRVDPVHVRSFINFKRRWGFLYTGYGPQFWYWELVVVWRKVCLVIICVFFFANLRVQALLAILLITCALMAHAAARPFTNHLVNWVEFASLVASFCTFFAGQFLFIETVPDNNRVVATVVIFVANFAFHALVIGIFVWIAREKCQRMRHDVETEKVRKEQLRERVKDLDLPQSIDETEYFEDRLIADRQKEKAAQALAAAGGKRKAGAGPGTGADGATGPGGDTGGDPTSIELASVQLRAGDGFGRTGPWLGDEENRRKAIADAKAKRLADELAADAALAEAERNAQMVEAGLTATSAGAGLILGKRVAATKGGAAAGGAAPGVDEKHDLYADADDDDPAVIAARAAADRALARDIAAASADAEAASDDDDDLDPEAAAKKRAKAAAAKQPQSHAKQIAALALKRMKAADGGAAEALKYRKEQDDDDGLHDAEIKKSQAEWAQTRNAMCIVS